MQYIDPRLCPKCIHKEGHDFETAYTHQGFAFSVCLICKHNFPVDSLNYGTMRDWFREKEEIKHENSES